MAQDLEGKVVLMTGATEGIGKAAAIALARRGATLALVGRNKEKSERVVAEIEAASGTKGVALILGDMSKIADMRAVADAFREKHDRLDVLVNNAGAIFMDYRLSADGLEMTFALDHLGYFVLTTRLLDLLQKTPGARVVSTSSGAHRTGKINLATIAKRDGSAGFSAYADAKLANILFTRELARRLAGSSATANCFHPGFVHTGFGLNSPGLFKWAIGWVAPLFARTPEKGAETLVWLATSPDAAKYNGDYFFDLQVASTNQLAKSDELAAGLWALSEKLTASAGGRDVGLAAAS